MSKQRMQEVDRIVKAERVLKLVGAHTLISKDGKYRRVAGD
ncbi:hypothetical protein [Rhizobium sp. NFR07]|nr:hypothetical protein [Rhizobium sp. NFR07]